QHLERLLEIRTDGRLNARGRVPDDGDAEPPLGRGFGEVEAFAHGARIAWVLARDGGQDQAAVLRAAAHGAELVERPGEGHGAVAADAAIGGPQAGDAAVSRGRDDRAGGFRTDGEWDQGGGDGGAGTGRGAARPKCGVP